MSGPSLILNETAQIKPLHGRDDWFEWDEKLRGQLGMIDIHVLLMDAVNTGGEEIESEEGAVEKTDGKKKGGLLLSLLASSSGGIFSTQANRFTMLIQTFFNKLCSKLHH